MSDLISALKKKAREEEAGSRDYRRLAVVLGEIGEPYLGKLAQDMAADEYRHAQDLLSIVEVLKTEVVPKLSRVR